MRKAKSILFRTTIKGYGVVNYDGGDQKYTFNALAKNQEKSRHDNVTYAKKQWTSMNDDGTADYKLIISTDCLKHEIFKNEMEFQSPNIIHHKSLLLNAIASPAMLLRGYMFAAKDSATLKRSSAITLSDAIQTNNAMSTIETFARSGQKTTDENQSDTTFFKKETIGDIEYQSEGSIDLMKLQFLSTDECFDRMALDPDMFSSYLGVLSTRMPVAGELGYYKIKGSIIDIPEYGYAFSNDNVVYLTKMFFEKLLGVSIKKSRSYAEVVDVEYKIVYDPLVDKFNSESGWEKLTKDNLDDFTFDMEDFYVPVDYDNAIIQRRDMDEKVKENMVKTKEQKEKKQKEKKTAKTSV